MFVVIFGINTTSDISKLLYVISRAVRGVKFETILKYHEWYFSNNFDITSVVNCFVILVVSAYLCNKTG